MMTESNNDTLKIQSPIVPSEVFGHATAGIEYELSELITDINLAADYTGDDAIIYAVGLAARANKLISVIIHSQVYQKTSTISTRLKSSNRTKHPPWGVAGSFQTS
jgi:hypothetical protein